MARGRDCTAKYRIDCRQKKGDADQDNARVLIQQQSKLHFLIFSTRFRTGSRNPDLQPAHLLADGRTVTSAEQLCLACGLCCDGSLFGHVRLGPDDDAKKLKSLGLPVSVSRAQNPVARFPQPCAALCTDRTCRVYADRPVQCRTFECGVFKDAQASRITFSSALRLVKQARQRVDKIRRLLRKLGDTEEHRSLDDRFHRTQQRVESSLADKKAANTFAELSLAMHAFTLLAFKKFYTKAGAEASPTKHDS